jgi:hypothetical protein
MPASPTVVGSGATDAGGTEVPGTRTRRSRRRSARRTRLLEAVLALALAGAVFVVHDVGYMLSHPFWFDESWVAASTRAPLGVLPWVTSSTPLGWTFLLRLVPGGGQQDLRLLTLAFSAGAVAVAYLLGRELRLVRYAGGVVVGAAVLLAPALLIRDDLKQYTAEAFASVLVLLLVARVENHWTRARLFAIAAVVSLGLLIANAVVFVGVAAMAGLALEASLRRSGRRVLDVAIAGAAMVAGSAVVYEVVDKTHVVPGITAFWKGYYVPHDNVSAAWSFLHTRSDLLAPYAGFRSLPVDIVLALAGVVVLVRTRRYALAVTVPLTIVLVVVASADSQYPFGDLRTSTFWLVMVTVLMSIAVLGAITLLASRSSVAAGVAVVAVLVGWVFVVHPMIRSHPLPAEDVRSQIQYVDAHRHPGDVVVLDFDASWGFAYYQPGVTATFRSNDSTTIGYLPVFSHVPWLVQITTSRPQDIGTALARATTRAQSATSSAGRAGRIWIIRTHLHPSEIVAWSRDLRGKDVQTISVGPEPLLLYTPS